MKNRVSLISVIVIILVVLMFRWIFWSGSYQFLHETDSWEKVTVESIEVDGVVGSKYFTGTGAYNQEKITVLKAIQDQKQFIHEFRSLKSYKPLGDPIGAVTGTMIRLTYPDGTVELISSFGCALISGTDVHVYPRSFEKDEFRRFIAKWLNAAPVQ